MSSVVEDLQPQATVTPVAIGGVRGGPPLRTVLRKDRWWLQPAATVFGLTAFVVYATWAAFRNGHYYVGFASAQGRDYLSPLYSPCLTHNCQGYVWGPITGSWWSVSPALLILIFPLAFRATCYYYRKAYYRSFWQSPPACGVADGHARYTGETRFPLIVQNIHRYFFYLGLILNVILTIDAIEAFRFPGQGIGVSVGTLVLVANAALLWCYTMSCHACRHLCGGHVNTFSKHPIRHRIWKFLTPLNARHMQIAWASLVGVALCDLYVRLVASGAFTDPKLF